jgi:hypothetical protein
VFELCAAVATLETLLTELVAPSVSNEDGMKLCVVATMLELRLLELAVADG